MQKGKDRYTGYNSSNLEKSRQLRRNMTKQERHLWYDFLKSYPIHFYRQRPIDKYIVDFYCADAKLVVELDGDQHGEPEALAYDAARTKALNGYGLTVIRFTNPDVDRSFEGVCYSIHCAVKERLRQTDNTSGLAALVELEKKLEYGG